MTEHCMLEAKIYNLKLEMKQDTATVHMTGQIFAGTCDKKIHKVIGHHPIWHLDLLHSTARLLACGIFYSRTTAPNKNRDENRPNADVELSVATSLSVRIILLSVGHQSMTHDNINSTNPSSECESSRQVTGKPLLWQHRAIGVMLPHI